MCVSAECLCVSIGVCALVLCVRIQKCPQWVQIRTGKANLCLSVSAPCMCAKGCSSVRADGKGVCQCVYRHHCLLPTPQ